MRRRENRNKSNGDAGQDKRRGLFSEKTEISVTYTNSADLDQAIKDNVRKLMRLYGGRETAIDVDLDKEFGPTLEIEMAEEVEPDEPDEPAPPAEENPNA
jgi:hypothetical protein